jgi:hypothetical protein
MNTWVSLLHPAVVAPADQFPGGRKQGRPDGYTPLVKAQPSLFERHRKHRFIQICHAIHCLSLSRVTELEAGKPKGLQVESGATYSAQTKYAFVIYVLYGNER